LAEAVRIAKNTIARLEQGGITDLRGQVIAWLAQVLGVSTDYLLGLDESEQAMSNSQSGNPKRATGRPKTKAWTSQRRTSTTTRIKGLLS